MRAGVIQFVKGAWSTGERVVLDASVLDRGDSVPLASPGQWSANRTCRMIEARDGWIAATALVHGLTIITRNVADFEATAVRIVNPWDGGGVT